MLVILTGAKSINNNPDAGVLATDPLLSWQDLGLPFKDKPKLLRPISIGRTNRSYLVEASGRLYVLRINAPNSHILGIDRQREKTLVELASKYGIGPQVHFCSIEHGVLLTEFIEGRHWQPGDLKDPEKLDLLTRSMEVLHSLPVTPLKFQYRLHAEHYWEQLLSHKPEQANTLSGARDRVLGILDETPARTCICHHDPIPANIVESAGKLFFLDWEYAAPGWSAFDYAAISVEWCVELEDLKLPAYISVEECLKAKELYCYLCRLWEHLQGNQS